MSDEKKTSLLSSAWRAALALFGIAVCVWVAAKLLLEVWWIVLIAVAVGFGLWLLVRWIRSRDRW
jgi:predicted PurR-regulated permease PerM